MEKQWIETPLGPGQKPIDFISVINETPKVGSKAIAHRYILE